MQFCPKAKEAKFAMKPGLRRGKLTKWQDDRGFGFIQPADSSAPVFLHISELKDATRRPVVGDTIYYHLAQQDGKIRAMNAFILGARVKSGSPSASIKPQTTGSIPSQPFPILEVLLLAILPLIGVIHAALTTGYFWSLLVYPAMGSLSFLLYADDKDRARRKVWRTSEKTLLLCDLLGGWIGGFMAQRTFRHKVRKVSYQVVFWLIVLMHYLFWLTWLIWGRALIS